MESLPEVKVDKTEHWNLEEMVDQVQLLKANVAMLGLAAKDGLARSADADDTFKGLARRMVAVSGKLESFEHGGKLWRPDWPHSTWASVRRWSRSTMPLNAETS